jgi:thioredoxin-related protein
MPIVNELKSAFPGQLQVISVDVQSSLGRELANEYGNFTPTFIFFDEQGKELWRTIGVLDADQVRQSLP